MKGLGSSKWWNLTKKYYQIINKKKYYVSSKISPGKIIEIKDTQKEISNDDIGNIIAENIESLSTNDVYMLLTDRYLTS